MIRSKSRKCVKRRFCERGHISDAQALELKLNIAHQM